MELLARAVGPVGTNVYVLADPSSREAIAVDTAIPSLAWIRDELEARDDGGWDGRGLLLGREIGRFRLVRDGA